MPVVEVIRIPLSDRTSLATGLALAIRLGKTPIVVNDAPSFIVNRVLFPNFTEALNLASEGMPIDRIDDAMKRWGMPMGPFELLDHIGVDVAVCILRAMEGSVLPRSNLPAVLDQAIARNDLGKKTRRGFYLYPTPSPKVLPPPNRDLLAALFPRVPPAPAATPDVRAIQDRLLAPMIDQARRLLAESVVSNPDAIDLATVLGLGLAPFRGGLAHWGMQNEK